MSDAVRQEKLQYLQAKVVYEELKDILLDYEISRLHETDNPSAQVWTMIDLVAKVYLGIVQYRNYNFDFVFRIRVKNFLISVHFFL